MRVGLITGITGQDGSYLADLLIEKGYKVYGLIRRASNFNTQRIDHIYKNPNLILKYSDMTDSSNLCRIFYDIINENPDLERLEVYNLAAMSHVKVSFEIPEYTAQVDAIGPLRILEAIRITGLSPKTRFYQASSSEMFGKVQEIPQNEKTPFYPRSPYGVAKLYGYWITKNYRESYGMHASNGILFNHETLAGFMPLIFRQNNIINIKPISEIVKYHTSGSRTLVDETKNIYQEGEVEVNLEVWDDNKWTKVTFASGYPHFPKIDNKNPRFIISNNAAYLVTGNHVVIMNDETEKKAMEIKLGDDIKLIKYPKIKYTKNKTNGLLNLNENEAELLGLFVRYGVISDVPIFKNKSKIIINRIIKLWEKMCNRYKKNSEFSISKIKKNQFDNTMHLELFGFNDFFSRYDIYNEDKTKKVPFQILNSTKNIMMKFLIGYNKCICGFKIFKTDSACLAQGLLYLIKKTTTLNFDINVSFVKKFNNKRLQYDIIFKNEYNGYKQGESQKQKNSSIKNIIEYYDYDGWFYDLETESGKFHAGIGLGRIHNSPRRGLTFVTRKITHGLGKILKGEQDKLVMGNLNAIRDWGHAKDFVEGMYLMLQKDKPGDYVLATGELHSVREFIEKCFSLKGIDIKWKGKDIEEKGYDKKTGKVLIEVSEKYFRPAEVDLLLGDYSKAKKELGWEPKYSFDKMVKEMVDYDCNELYEETND